VAWQERSDGHDAAKNFTDAGESRDTRGRRCAPATAPCDGGDAAKNFTDAEKSRDLRGRRCAPATAPCYGGNEKGDRHVRSDGITGWTG